MADERGAGLRVRGWRAGWIMTSGCSRQKAGDDKVILRCAPVHNMEAGVPREHVIARQAAPGPEGAARLRVIRRAG
jgi:hypothetical protein